jgi:hypothetical protein
MSPSGNIPPCIILVIERENLHIYEYERHEQLTPHH